MPDADRHVITLLQGLRAAAALAVVLHHVLHDGLALTGAKAAPEIGGLSWDIGIDVFFVISGFVMVHASARLFAAPGATWRFLARRIARVAPIYWAATTAFLAAALLLGGTHAPLGGPAYVAASYVFIPWARPDGVMHPLYEVGWTLNYEMFFYAVFALCVALPRRAAAACASLALLAGIAWAPSVQPFAYWTDPIVGEFVLGIAIACLLREGVWLSNWTRAGLLLAGAVALLALNVAAPNLHRALRFGLPAACAVAAATLGPEPRLPRRLIAAMLVLGDASYALYLVHPFVMRAAQIVWLRLRWTGGASLWTYVLAATCLSLAASIAVHAWAEAPMTRVARRLLGGRPARPARLSSAAE